MYVCMYVCVESNAMQNTVVTKPQSLVAHAWLTLSLYTL